MMPPPVVFPTIPVPDTTPNGLFNSVTALKRCVEMLTGLDPQSLGGIRHERFAPHVFMQPDTPEALHPGDIWMCTRAPVTLNMWEGSRWLLLLTVPP